VKVGENGEHSLHVFFNWQYLFNNTAEYCARSCTNIPSRAKCYRKEVCKKKWIAVLDGGIVSLNMLSSSRNPHHAICSKSNPTRDARIIFSHLTDYFQLQVNHATIRESTSLSSNSNRLPTWLNRRFLSCFQSLQSSFLLLKHFLLHEFTQGNDATPLGFRLERQPINA